MDELFKEEKSSFEFEPLGHTNIASNSNMLMTPILLTGPEAGNQEVLAFGRSGIPGCFAGFFLQDQGDKLLNKRNILLGGFP